ncbi:MAG: tRNA lysidine(34) synthetase TilS [Parabacteroides sp.]|nr:tRNA lysidine(34) synthetase TilS [Parabacteroides sp.]MCI7009636.1 tRNA lysidine(34) synthetase TilS [Parabacteroides sp.]MCI7783818.1 tRNA lysidine(34) synthetase TilS [Parabacteroides sp.]MDD6080790.1 tRNA lysidine(34) synthetase TilS [bacterium]MDY4757909.1 tRNA lysidine(34) synthetase TilS [Parabacteroides sp.]
MFQSKVERFIQQQGLLTGKKLVLVGLSGGADSVALLGVLVRLGYSCRALHCNFHLRGEESDRDEAFACRFADSLEVPFLKIDFDTIGYAKMHHESIEMAARTLRYRWFEEQRRAFDAEAIAVAHHRDDSVETLLMNLLRGSGLRGLGGIRPRNGLVVRPLLAVNRSEIEEWLNTQGWEYMTDSSNLSDTFTRNFIRLRVLPLLEQLNPAAREAIARSAAHLSAAEQLYDYMVEEARKEVFVSDGSLSIEALMRYPAPETLLYEWLRPYGFSRIVVSELFEALTGLSGKQFYSATHQVLKDRDRLYIAPLQEPPAWQPVTIPVATGELMQPIRLSVRLIERTHDFQMERTPNVAYFDVDKLPDAFSLRLPYTGDWFVPFGMRGRKKLSDFFADQKMTRWEKAGQALLCAGDSIAWVVGRRADDRFRVDETTKMICSVKKIEQREAE